MASVGLVLQGRYRLVAELGRGGMSAVYLVKDLNLDSYWAVKQVANNSSMEFEAFKKEVELLASFSHPDIPRIVDRIEEGNDYFVVMDFVDGMSLAKVVETKGAQPEYLVVEWGKMLCDVLEYLHTVRTNPIVYRDMKPENVMLTQLGRIKLIDFGIAKECRRDQKLIGESLGTKGYAAPEQYTGASNKLDERTDIYSLGATLFHLATGVTPNMPPNGVPLVRQEAPYLSEGLEYVIAKCTADVPANRYQSVAALRDDLENITSLTTSYRRGMKRRLVAFVTCLALCMIFSAMSFVGYSRIQVDRENAYQASFQAATAHGRAGEHLQAAERYSQAIEMKPEDRETYILFFQSLLPQSGSDEGFLVTKAAIDEMRKRYLDNEHSAMYHDPQLLFIVAKRCLEVEDPAYAQYALDYLKIIREDDTGSNVNELERKSYEVIANHLVYATGEVDFSAFAVALEELESYTDEANLSVDERLTNYYIIINMYSTYPSAFENAYEKTYEIGGKVRTILETAPNIEEVAFNNIIPLYRRVATAQYNGACVYTDRAQKERAFLNSLEWFGYIDEMEVALDENMILRRANAHKGIFDLYNTPSGRSAMDSEAVSHLHMAVELYQGVIEKNEDSLLAYVYLTQAYLDMELLEPIETRNFGTVIVTYNKVLAIRDTSDNLSVTEVQQLGSLRRQLLNAGLEVE